MFEYKNIEAYNLFHQGALALAQIERNGMCINTKYLRRSIKKVADKIEQKTENLKKYDEYKEWQKQYKNNMNLDSTQQLGKVLFDAMGYKTTITTKTGKPKVDEGVLNGLKIKFVDDLLYIRKLKKAKTTYLEAILKQTIDGKLHPSFNLHLVQTFRSSSSAPNFQNIPKHNPLLSKLIRQAFIPRKNHHLIEVDYSGAEIRCFTGDTLIETIDGKKTIQEIVLTHTEKEIYVYCYNNEQKRIGISKVVDGGMTRVKTPIIKVTLDNGEIIKTTADHSFMLRTGEYKKAGQLNTGDSLMPFYKKAVRLSGGKVVYERIYLNNGLKMLAHNLIAMDVLDTCIKGSALLVHHKDSNGTNNSLSNLQIMDRKKHMHLHSKQGWRKNTGGRNKHTKTEEYKEYMRQFNAKRKKEWTPQQWEEFSNRISEGLQRVGGTAGIRNSMYGKKHSKETIKKMSKSKKELWKRQNHPFLGRSHSLESRQKMSISQTGRVTSEETKKKLSKASLGKKHTEQSKKKMSIISSAFYKSEKSIPIRRALSEQRKKYWQNKQKELCAICNKSFSSLTNTHLKYAHSITLSEYKDMYNHKVLSVEPCGYDAVYNIEVDKHHNYALSAGVIVKNCAACYHKDNNMIKYITDESLDMHRDMAAQIYMIDKDKITKDIRHAGKNLFVFPQFYGDFYINCARNMWETIEKNKLTLADGTPLYTHLKNKGINKLGDCSFDATAKKGTFVYHMKTIEDDFWNNKFKKYGQWKWDWYNMYLKNGFFDTLTGFRLYGNFKKNEVINYPVQGSAFHWLLWSLIRLNKTLNKYKMKSVIIGQIHDSIVADVHKDELKTFLNITNKIMTIKIREYYKWIIVPLKIEAEISGVNESWYKLKEINI
jgi:intein/homing endonuclease